MSIDVDQLTFFLILLELEKDEKRTS